MIECRILLENIKAFLIEYFPQSKVLEVNTLFDNRITTNIIYKNFTIAINIIIIQYMCEIVLESHLSSLSENYNDLILQNHVYCAPTDLKGINIIEAFKEIYPKFEQTIKIYTSKAV